MNEGDARMFRVKQVLGTMALALVAGLLFVACHHGSSSTDSDSVSSDPMDKFVGGKWLTRDITKASDGWDVVFKSDGTYEAYLPDGTTVKIYGPWSVDASGNVTGTFKATNNSRVGNIEAHLESSDTVLYFKFIETNACDNPAAVNCVIATENRGKNPTKPASSGSSDTSSSSSDAIAVTDITWDGGTDPSGWPITATMTNLAIEANGTAGCTVHNPPSCDTIGPCVKFDFTNPSSWPQTGKIIGSGWVIGKVNGVWHAGVWEAIKPGGDYFTTTEQCSNQSEQFVQALGDVATHHFEKGEEIGFMFSTVARGSHPEEPKGRSPIIKTTYPF
jgi:hypothetical protein